MNKDRLLGVHSFIFNKKDNGGESLSLTTSYYDNGDGPVKGCYTDQELTLQSYGNSATFNFSGIQITPNLLRELANELESAEIKAKSNHER